MENFLLAFQNIRSGKARAALTMLGIIIGIAAVMVIIGIGNGMEGYLTESFQSMGTKTLSLNVTRRGTTRTVTPEDIFEIVDTNPKYFEDMSPTVSVSGTVKVGNQTLEETTVTGVGEKYFKINSQTVAKGRNLRYVDMASRARVCVVGAYVDAVWYGGRSVGQTIRFAGDVYEIVGVLESKVEELEEGGSDDAIYLPYSTAARLTRNGRISNYTLTITSEELAAEATDTLESELYERLRSENAYRVVSMAEMLDTMTEMIGVVITVLAVIAGISLVVGGVGIMNIMLVSVSERTREIGIRKALGAKQRYIMSQFVIEAAVISALGGIVGIIMGYALSTVATAVISGALEVEMTVAPTAASVFLAFGASAGIGVIFGYLPARKAAKLNPIDALRYD